MTGLREMFEDLADPPAPARPTSGDEVYAAGRRRHRQRRGVLAAGALALLSVVAGGTLAMRGDGGRPVEPTPADRTVPSPTPTPDAERVQGIVAADREHLYGWRLYCPASPCDKRRMRVAASTDGGRTWGDRGGPIGVGGLAAVGVDTLLLARPDAASTPLVSPDGGRSWTSVGSGPAVQAVPGGHLVLCWPAGGKVCRLSVVHPSSGRLAPLGSGPPLVLRAQGLALLDPDRTGGALWIAGADPASGRPAVAVSTDRGRTWTIRVFRELAECAQDGCDWRSVTAADGGPAYLVIQDPAGGRPLVYRSGPAGGWERLDSGPVPPGRPADGPGYVTRDGRHVWCQVTVMPGRDLDGCVFWVVDRTGRRYRAVDPDGLPATVDQVRRGGDGTYHARDLANGQLYGSADGWHWTPVPAR